MSLDLQFLYQVFDQQMPTENIQISRVVIDSRDIQSGDVFFALKGERFDAHDFVQDVLKKDVAAVIVEHDYVSEDPRIIRVKNTRLALGQLAHKWRIAINPVVLGITGSSGKTSVKEMTASILRSYAGAPAVLATQGNFNNDIGVPLTLLRLNSEHRFLVIEMGMNHAGELSYLSDLVRPDVALVNNALRAHIGCGFQSVADIARAKAEIYQGLSEIGIAIVPQEDDHLAVFLEAAKNHPIYSFGLSRGNVRAANIHLYPLCSEFELIYEDQSMTISLPAAGQHNVLNAIAAASLCLAINVPLEMIQTGLANFINAKGRLELKQGMNQARIIDDTYNANPDSMKAAIDVLAQFTRPRIMVMGDMGELGETAPDLHTEIGRYAKTRDIDYFFALGEMSQYAANAFGEASKHFIDIDPLLEKLKPLMQGNVTVLVKGSRFMKMERVVDALTHRI